MKFGLNDEEIEVLNNLVVNPLKFHGAQVWIFGSRARGTQNQFSDIDLLYEASSPLKPGFIADLVEAVEESRLAYKVDIVDVAELAKSYEEGVLKDRVKV